MDLSALGALLVFLDNHVPELLDLENPEFDVVSCDKELPAKQGAGPLYQNCIGPDLSRSHALM